MSWVSWGFFALEKVMPRAPTPPRPIWLPVLRLALTAAIVTAAIALHLAGDPLGSELLCIASLI